MTTTVKQLLNTKSNEIFSVTSDTMVIDAIRKMAELKIGALPVIDNDKLVGILSERDYSRKVVLFSKNSKETPVSEIMTPEVKTVSPSNTVDECMEIMSDYHIRHLPIIDNDQVVGVLSIMDVVKNIISEKEFTITQLEHYITDTA